MALRRLIYVGRDNRPIETQELRYRRRTSRVSEWRSLIEDLVNPFNKREFLVAWEGVK